VLKRVSPSANSIPGVNVRRVAAASDCEGVHSWGIAAASRQISAPLLLPTVIYVALPVFAVHESTAFTGPFASMRSRFPNRERIRRGVFIR